MYSAFFYALKVAFDLALEHLEVLFKCTCFGTNEFCLTEKKS